MVLQRRSHIKYRRMHHTPSTLSATACTLLLNKLHVGESSPSSVDLSSHFQCILELARAEYPNEHNSYRSDGLSICRQKFRTLFVWSVILTYVYNVCTSFVKMHMDSYATPNTICIVSSTSCISSSSLFSTPSSSTDAHINSSSPLFLLLYLNSLNIHIPLYNTFSFFCSCTLLINSLFCSDNQFNACTRSLTVATFLSLSQSQTSSSPIIFHPNSVSGCRCSTRY